MQGQLGTRVLTLHQLLRNTPIVVAISHMPHFCLPSTRPKAAVLCHLRVQVQRAKLQCQAPVNINAYSGVNSLEEGFENRKRSGGRVEWEKATRSPPSRIHTTASAPNRVGRRRAYGDAGCATWANPNAIMDQFIFGWIFGFYVMGRRTLQGPHAKL